jgi:hypothetical protein
LGFQSAMSESTSTTGMSFAARSSTGLSRSEEDGAMASASTSWASRFSTMSICSAISVSALADCVMTSASWPRTPASAPFLVLTQYSWLSDLGT